MLRRALLRSAQRRNSGCGVSFLLRFLAVAFTNEFQQLRSRNWPTGGLLGSGADSLADFSKSLFWLLATQHYQRLIKSLLNNIVYWDYWLHPVWPSAVQDGWSQSHHQAVCNAEPCLNNLQIASHALTTVEDHSAASGSWSNLAPIRCGTKWGSQHGRNRVKPAESAGPTSGHYFSSIPFKAKHHQTPSDPCWFILSHRNVRRWSFWERLSVWCIPMQFGSSAVKLVSIDCSDRSPKWLPWRILMVTEFSWTV